MNKTAVIDIVGLCSKLIGDQTPFIKKFVEQNGINKIKPAFPALTTTAQSDYLTGKKAGEHGIVGNGWYDRQEAEIKYWKQSNHLVEGDKIWHKAKKINPDFTCSKMFWWYNMYSDADYSVTPRPQYHADGVKAPDCYSYPAQLRDELQAKLGTFPLFNFWGPNANIKSTRWIAEASIHVDQKYNPTLNLIYLPHLDYCLQKFGPEINKISKELNEIDEVVKDLVEYFESKGAEIILLSEYGINPVDKPIDINRFLREKGGIAIREEKGLELLDAGASRAFATADHQVAHVYVKNKAEIGDWKKQIEKLHGVKLVLDKEEQKAYGINHKRSGDLLLVAEDDAWFTYYFWKDDSKAPDYARMVDIHKKPGYDPVEMFMNPKNPFIKLKAGFILLKKILGFRYTMNVIPLDANLIKGSHGSPFVSEEFYPILIGKNLKKQTYNSTDIQSIILEKLGLNP